MITLDYDAIMKDMPQTNEEWFCDLSTEEKAKWLKESFDKCCKCALKQYDQRGECPFGRCRNGINEYKEWLKEKHTE